MRLETTAATWWWAPLLAVALAACGGKSAEDVLSSARSKAATGDRVAAMVELRGGLEQHPESTALRLEFARELMAHGDHRDAQIELRKLLLQKELTTKVVPLLARSLTQVGQFDKAIAEFGDARLDDAKAMADLAATLALAHGALQHADQASILANESLRLDSSGVAARLVLARVKAAKEGPTAAMPLVDESLALQPANVDAWMLKGDLQVAAGAPPYLDAVAAYQKVIQLAPNAPRAHSALIGVQLARKDLDAAEKAVESMRKQLPAHPQTVFFQAQLAFMRQDYARAAELIAQVLKVTPDAVNALVLAGATELRRGAWVQAEAFLTKAQGQAPDRLSTKRLLAATYLKSGQASKAVNLLSPLVQSVGSRQDLDSLLLLAEAHLQQGNHQLADQYFERALKQKPNDSMLRTTLALIDVSQGNFDQAVAELAAISEQDKGVVADKALINTYLARKDVEGALAAIARLDRKQPNSALTAALHGYALLAKGDKQGARGDFDLALTRDPRFASAAGALAALDLKENRVDSAMNRHRGILTSDPKNMQSLIALAELSAINGAGKDQVIRLYEAAISAHPSEVLPRRLLVHYLIARKDFRGAVLSAVTASNALPRSTEILDSLAQAQLLSGDTNQALGTLGRSLALNPRNASAYAQMANALQVAGDLSNAEKNLRRAIAVEPKNIQIRLDLVSLLLRQKQYGKALIEARQLQQILPDQAASDVLEGDVHVAAGNLELALTAYRRGLERKNYVHSAMRVHTTLLALKREDQARKFAADWAAKQPRDFRFVVYLGKRALEKGDMVEAEVLHRRAVSLVAEPDAALLNNLAWVLVRNKSPDALGYATSAYKLAPERLEVIDTYGLALAGVNKIPEAIELIGANILKFPANTSLKFTLIKLHLRAGDLLKAKEMAGKLQSEIKSERDKAAMVELRKLLEP